MATPTFVKFSRIHGKVFDVLGQVNNVVEGKWQSTLREVVRLRPSNSDYDGGFELDGVIKKCESLQDAETITEGTGAFSLIYLAKDIPAEYYFYLFEIAPGEFSVTLSIESSIVYFENCEYESGQWLEGFLTSIVCVLKSSVCGYGSDAAYSCKHESLDPDEVLRRLRSGELLQLPRPIFHAISNKLIDKNEIDALIAQYKPKASPKYRMAPGYHILGSVGL